VTRRSILARLEESGRRAPRLRLRPLPDEDAAGAAPADRSTIPCHEIRGEIGRGGVGTVFRGHDVDLGRDVAVKVLHRDHVRTPDLVRRFVEEAQIGAQLQHPGIVPVYELGLQADRRPFFTMKLIHGETLATILRARSDPRADRRRVLSIFERVCLTIAYGHSCGVMHRDLKPTNVMVGAFGEVQIVDWGFAKVLAAGREPRAAHGAIVVPSAGVEGGTASAAGAVMGTPAYMPPEQARGEELDERSDVFALGSILCEILTGQPPYAAEGGDPLLQAAEAGLAAAHARLDACRADEELVSLCRGCLAPEPDDRPRDAGVLAEVVSEHLAGVEVRAHRSRLAAVEERGKAARARAQAEEARAAAIEQRRARRQALGLTAAILLAVVVGGGGWLWREAGRRERARATAELVYAALDEAADFRRKPDLEAAIAASERARDLAALSEENENLRREAAELLADLQAEDREARAAAARDEREAVLRARLLHLGLSSNDVEFDAAATDAAFAATFAELGVDVESLAPEALASVLRFRRDPAFLAGALDEWARIKLLREARQGRDLVRAATALAPEWRELLRGVDGEEVLSRLRELAKGADLADWPARRLDRLVVLLDAFGDPDAAREVLSAAQWCHPDDLWLNNHLGNLLLQSDSEEAVRVRSTALALRPEHACLWHQLALALRFHGDYEESLAASRKAASLQPAHATHDVLLGIALREQGESQGAVAALERAVELGPESARAHAELGIARHAAGDVPGACEALRRATTIDPSFSRALLQLGNALLRARDPQGAATAYRQDLRQRPEHAEALGNLGAALLKAADPTGAVPVLREALRLEPGLAVAHYNLGLALYRVGDLEGGVASLRQAFRRDPTVAESHSYLGLVLADQGNLDGALSVFREAVAEAPDDASARNDVGMVLRLRGERDAAIAEHLRASELDPALADCHRQLALALSAQGDLDRARAHIQRAIELEPDVAAHHNGLGLLQLQSGDLEAAARAFGEASERAPDDAGIRLNVASVLFRQGDARGALAHVDKVRESILRTDPPFSWKAAGVGRVHYARGVILCYGLREHGRAAVEFGAAIRRSPDRPILHLSHGDALAGAGRFKEARAAYRKALALDPELDAARNNLGCLLNDAFQDFHGAADQFRACIRRDPGHAVAQGNLGHALCGLRDYEQAEAAFRRAIDLAPHRARGHADLGILVMEHLWPFERASSALEEAVRLAPRNVLYLMLLAEARRFADDAPRAIDALRRVLDLCPDQPKALEGLAYQLATGADPNLRNPEEALRLVQRAEQVCPSNLTLRTLGVANYRLGRYEKAVRFLERIDRMWTDGAGERVCFFLSMAHAKLGHDDEARKWYDRAVSGSENWRDLPDRQRLQAEARAVVEGSAD
jgi:serine/threonine-protein kinase